MGHKSVVVIEVAILVSQSTVGVQRNDRVLLGPLHNRVDIGSRNESHRCEASGEARFRGQA